MKADHPKLKTPPRNHLFSCAFFRHCTQNVLSPTTTTPPPLPLPLATQPPPPPPSSSSSSSSNTSQSFTQWRFPLSTSPICHRTKPEPVVPDPTPESDPMMEKMATGMGMGMGMDEVFHVAELQFGSGSESDRVAAVQLMEKSLLPNPRTAASEACLCPTAVVASVVACLREGVARKAASKVLLALCLVEGNRRVAVETGAVTAVVEAMADVEGTVAERSLAALELLCTAAEGAAEVRAHALAVPMMVQVMGGWKGGGRSTQSAFWR